MASPTNRRFAALTNYLTAPKGVINTSQQGHTNRISKIQSVGFLQVKQPGSLSDEEQEHKKQMEHLEIWGIFRLNWLLQYIKILQN